MILVFNVQQGAGSLLGQTSGHFLVDEVNDLLFSPAPCRRWKRRLLFSQHARHITTGALRCKPFSTMAVRITLMVCQFAFRTSPRHCRAGTTSGPSCAAGCACSSTLYLKSISTQFRHLWRTVQWSAVELFPVLG
jgi:hypothetical protein